MKATIFAAAAVLALAACQTTSATAHPKNAASSSAVTTGQPRATDEDISTTRTTSAEIRAEQPPKPAPEPGRKGPSDDDLVPDSP